MGNKISQGETGKTPVKDFATEYDKINNLDLYNTSCSENSDVSNISSITSQKTYRVLTYNVEWGFIDLPKDITSDSCGHKIPNTKYAQEEHLVLISKNIGLIKPDICFLQEMGSKSAVELIANNIFMMFNITYKYFYSNDDEVGNQGVGLLIIDNIAENCVVSNIPNFKLNRALGIKLNTKFNSYKLVGVHLKSLYDKKIAKDEEEQKDQIMAMLDWVKDEDNVILSGDFNNTPDSSPIALLKSKGFLSSINSENYVPNITGDLNTEFHGTPGNESGSKIDYIFVSPSIDLVSSHIINIERESKRINDEIRGENSDHLPVLVIVNLL